MDMLQQIWIAFFALYCFMPLVLYYQQSQGQKRPGPYEPQDPDVCSDPLVELFGKELASHLVRTAVSAVVGVVGGMFKSTGNSVVILILFGVLIGVVMERTFYRRK